MERLRLEIESEGLEMAVSGIREAMGCRVHTLGRPGGGAKLSQALITRFCATLPGEDKLPHWVLLVCYLMFQSSATPTAPVGSPP